MKNRYLVRKINENNGKKNMLKKRKSKNKIFTKTNILIFFIPLAIAINIYLINKNPSILELEEKIKALESKIENMEKEVVKKKVSIALVTQHIYLNGIGRFITVLGDLLVKTGKYDVYLIY